MNKKLSLKRETLQRLQADEALHVAGGNDNNTNSQLCSHPVPSDFCGWNFNNHLFDPAWLNQSIVVVSPSLVARH